MQQAVTVEMFYSLGLKIKEFDGTDSVKLDAMKLLEWNFFVVVICEWVQNSIIEFGVRRISYKRAKSSLLQVVLLRHLMN